MSTDTNHFTSVVFRLKREKMDALRALSKSTRVRQSEYLREAIADLLKKYEEAGSASGPPEEKASFRDAALLLAEFRREPGTVVTHMRLAEVLGPGRGQRLSAAIGAVRTELKMERYSADGPLFAVKGVGYVLVEEP